MFGWFKKQELFGMPFWMGMILVMVTWAASAMGWLPNNMAGAFAFIVVIGTFIGWFGEVLPFWNKWFGGGIMMAWLVGSIIYTYHLLPDSVIETVNYIGIEAGFRDFYIVILVVGSLFGIQRKLLVKAVVRFIPTVLGGVAISFLFAMLAGLIVGVNPIQAVLNYALPVMGGGTGAGAVPMSEMWAAATGRDAAIWFAPAFAALCVGDTLAAVGAAVLNQLGKKFPRISGEGQMMRGVPNELPEEEGKEPIKLTLIDYGYGFALALFIYLFSDMYAKKISIINGSDIGFSIHTFAFLVIFTAILSIIGVIPERVRMGAQGMQKFFSTNLACPLMVVLGFGSSLYDFAEMLLPWNLFIIVMVVIGAIIGAGVTGYLCGFYPVEAAITAGLCMANAGNSGDIMVLGAAKRMHLLAFASISTRIGGSIILVIGSVLFGLFAK